MSSIFSRLINLAGNITGTLGVANGGTGLTTGTSGGILGFTASGTLASSGALTNHAVVVGGGAAATPTTIAAGTNGQLLVGVTSADPAFGSTVSAATTFSGGVVFNSGASNLNYYKSSAISSALTGASTAPTITGRAVRTGDMVTITYIASGSVTKSGNGHFDFSLPSSDYYPSATVPFIFLGTTLTVQAAKYGQVDTTGHVQFYADILGSNIPDTQTGDGFLAGAISYCVV